MDEVEGRVEERPHERHYHVYGHSPKLSAQVQGLGRLPSLEYLVELRYLLVYSAPLAVVVQLGYFLGEPVLVFVAVAFGQRFLALHPGLPFGVFPDLELQPVVAVHQRHG